MSEIKKRENRFELAILVNGKTIVARRFTTDQYSNEVRKSIDLNDIMADLVEQIEAEFKRQDLTYQYEGYDLKKNDFKRKFSSEIKEGREYSNKIGL